MSYVYFIQAEHGGPVKIGWAVDPEARRRDLQTGSAYTLVLRGIQPGTRTDEARLHRRFAASRLEGEWFEPTDELAAVIGRTLPAARTNPARTRVGAPPKQSTLVCDSCGDREAAFIDLRPWAASGCTAHLLCTSDGCMDEGYCIPLSEWNDTTGEGLDWRRHLTETKDASCIYVIDERLKRLTTLVLRYAREHTA